MRQIILALTLLCLGAQVWAQPSAEALRQSDGFANSAIDLIGQGDRRQAIIAALKGLPEAPNTAALADFPQAYEALLRAMAARIVNVDRPSWQAYSVNVDGTRAVVSMVYSTMISPGDGPATIEFDTETQTMVSRGGPVYLPIEEEPPHILVDPRTGDIIADLAPFGAVIGDGYGPAIPFTFSPDGRMVTAWHMRDGVVLRFDTMDGSPLPPLTDMAGRVPGTAIGFSPDGARFAAEGDDLIAIWEATETAALLETIPVPDHTISSDWTHDNQLLTLQVDGYEPGSRVTLSIRRDGRWEELVDLTGMAELPTQYMQVSKSGPYVLLDAETQVFLVNWETGGRVDLGRTGASFHQFIRNGTAVGALTESLMSFLSGSLNLKVMGLDGSDLAPEPRDWVTFDQYVVLNGANPDSYGAMRPYTYVADDLPDGPALWEAAMAILTDAERAEVASERIRPDGG